MPLHEYLCTSCGRTFEAIQSFREAPLATCNRCGGALKRLISAPAVQFKGSGWYVSDYGRSGSTPKTSENGSSVGESGKEAAGSGGVSKESSTEESSKKDSSKKDPSKKDRSKKGSSVKDVPGKDS